MYSEQPRLVIVDDEPFILSATAQLLRSSGFAVETCDRWVGVASTVRNCDPHVVLMDYNMPCIKGDELCSILKRNSSNPEMRVLIYSSEPEADLVHITARCGADGYIRKGVSPDTLVQELQRQLTPVAN